MNFFAIADTHLSGSPPTKPMEIFGNQWHNHWHKIKNDWQTRVKEEDVVLLAGDISWAMKLEEALDDLNAIAELPGKKLVIKGNHDYWWQTIGKMNKAVCERLTFIQNNFVAVGKIAVCGSRGWLCPEDPFFKPEDMGIYQRELGRVKTSLAEASKAGFTRKILMLHYPPAFGQRQASGFTDLLQEYQVEICVYGHLHGDSAKYGPQGKISNTLCYLVSCDTLDFKLQQII